jgi:hypothetical protein
MLQSCAPVSASYVAGFQLQEPHLPSCVALHDLRGSSRIRMNEDVMAKVEQADGHRRIVETPTEARQAEPGPSILALLTVSTIAAVFVHAIVWYVIFRT